MPQGRIEYRHGTQTYVLEAGDPLSFRSDIPHGREKLIELPMQFLSVIVYRSPPDA
jgi:hypothetical protein